MTANTVLIDTSKQTVSPFLVASRECLGIVGTTVFPHQMQAKLHFQLIAIL